MSAMSVEIHEELSYLVIMYCIRNDRIRNSGMMLQLASGFIRTYYFGFRCKNVKILIGGYVRECGVKIPYLIHCWIRNYCLVDRAAYILDGLDY